MKADPIYCIDKYSLAFDNERVLAMYKRFHGHGTLRRPSSTSYTYIHTHIHTYMHAHTANKYTYIDTYIHSRSRWDVSLYSSPLCVYVYVYVYVCEHCHHTQHSHTHSFHSFTLRLSSLSPASPASLTHMRFLSLSMCTLL